MNKIFKLKVLAFGLFATLALSSCANGEKKATTEEKAATEVAVPAKDNESPNVCVEEVKKECACTPDSKELCNGCKAKEESTCEGCPDEPKACSDKAEESCEGEGSCEGCPNAGKQECAGECGKC